MIKRIFFAVLIISVAAASAYYFWPEDVLLLKTKVTKIVVLKSRREMLLYHDESLLKTYTVSLGKDPAGKKIFEGDNKTPEGKYFIDSKNANSVCYKNIGISYPNEEDKRQAAKIGKPAGGNIKIHGLPNNKPYWGKFHRFKDWTNGCIAVTNEEMDELYAAVNTGTPIFIQP